MTDDMREVAGVLAAALADTELGYYQHQPVSRHHQRQAAALAQRLAYLGWRLTHDVQATRAMVRAMDRGAEKMRAILSDEQIAELKAMPPASERPILAYVVLSVAERAKGFVRPVRRSYTHVGLKPRLLACIGGGYAVTHLGENGCGQVTTMGEAIAETFAREPRFYQRTVCTRCMVARPVAEFVWEGTNEVVGSDVAPPAASEGEQP